MKANLRNKTIKRLFLCIAVVYDASLPFTSVSAVVVLLNDDVSGFVVFMGDTVGNAVRCTVR